jgi:hypothetical protein
MAVAQRRVPHTSLHENIGGKGVQAAPWAGGGRAATTWVGKGNRGPGPRRKLTTESGWPGRPLHDKGDGTRAITHITHTHGPQRTTPGPYWGIGVNFSK